MPKFALTLFFIVGAGVLLHAQDATKNFEFVQPNYKVPNSLYNKISFVDSRPGNKIIGMVDLGLLRNHETKLVLKDGFGEQLSAVLAALDDSTAKNGALLFQFNRFGFAEDDGTRYCYLIANLYASSGGGYELIGSIDTVLAFTSANANFLMHTEGKLITDFIAKNLVKDGNGATVYNIDEVRKIDSIEMHKLPLYRAETYTDGVYLSYAAFKEQKPDKQPVSIDAENGSIGSIRVLDSSGKKVKLRSKDVYAVVYKGQPYAATEYGYYQLFKSADDNFYFNGEVKIRASQKDVSGAQMALGLIGAALTAASGYPETYVLMIDYRNGAFIHLHKIPKPDTP